MTSAFARRFGGVLLYLLVIGLGRPAAAQPGGTSTIVGRVVDDSTGAPVSTAHVFIAQSTIGTTTDSSGYFRLTDVPPGSAQLYVSHVGYEPQRRSLVLSRDTTVRDTVRLVPTVIKAGGVSVTAARTEEWFDRLQRFRRLFVGPTDWAKQSPIRNPEALRFETAWWGRFTAAADAPLVVVNRALGYRVTYHLKQFEAQGTLVRWDGEPVFEPLSPADSSEARRWARNRRRAFRGSLRHFLLALLHDRVEEEQFRIYRRPRAWATTRGRPNRLPASRERLVNLQPTPPHEFSFTGRLVVKYYGEAEHPDYPDWADLRRAPRDHQTSYITLNERPVHIDRYGEFVEPYGATLYRYFAFDLRLAALLPRNYRPPDEQELPPWPANASR